MADRAAWMGEAEASVEFPFKKEKKTRPGTHSKAERLTHELSVSLECLSTGSTFSRWKEGDLQKLPLGEMPARGRRAGLATHICGDTVERTGHFVWLRSSHPQLSTGGSVMKSQLEPCGIRLWWPPRTVSRKIKLDTNCLGTKLSYKCTTNRQQRNGPSQNRHIQKMSPRWPWDMDESSEKQMSPAPHAGLWRDVPANGKLSKLAEWCLGDSLNPPAHSHQPLRGSSR